MRDRLLPLASALQAQPDSVKQSLQGTSDGFGYQCGTHKSEHMVGRQLQPQAPQLMLNCWTTPSTHVQASFYANPHNDAVSLPCRQHVYYTP